MLLVDDVQFLEGKHAHRGGVLPHLQRPLRGRQPARPLRRPAAQRALDPRRAPARPLRVGPDRPGRAARPGDPPHRPAAPRPRGRARERRPRRALRARRPDRRQRPPPPRRPDQGDRPRLADGEAAQLRADRRADPQTARSRAEPTTVEEIQQRVAAAFGISRAELVGSSRAATPLRARQVAILLTRELTDLSLPQIGRLYGGRDHSTVLNSLRRAEAALGRGRRARRPGRRACARRSTAPPAHGLTADGAVRINAFPQPRPQPANPMRSAESTASSAVSTSPNPTQEGNQSFEADHQTRRARLQALDRLPRGLDPRRDPGAVGNPPQRRRGRRRARARPTSRWACGPTLEAEVDGERRGPAARPAARRARPLARRRRRSRSSCARPSATSRSAAAARSFHLRVLPAEDFPKLPDEGGEPLKIPAAALAETVDLVARAASRDDMRPVLTGVLVSAAGAGDDDGRHRLLPARGQADRAGERRSAASSRRTSRPGRCASWAGSSPPTGSRRSRSACCRNQAVFRAGAILLNTRLIDGQFPNFRQLLPESYEHDVRLPRPEFLDVARRVSQLAQRNAPLRLSFAPGELKVAAVDPRRRRRRGDDAGGVRGRAAGDRLQPRVPQATGSKASRATR